MKGEIARILDNSRVMDYVEILVQPSKGGMKLLKLRQGDAISINPQTKPKNIKAGKSRTPRL